MASALASCGAKVAVLGRSEERGQARVGCAEADGQSDAAVTQAVDGGNLARKLPWPTPRRSGEHRAFFQRLRNSVPPSGRAGAWVTSEDPVNLGQERVN